MRTKPGDNPPPPPFDTFLKRYECRIFKKRGDVEFRVSKNKEAIYYHPNANCLAQNHGEGNATNITVPNHIRPQFNMTGRKNRELQVPSVVPYKALENFPKALYGTMGGTCSARFVRLRVVKVPIVMICPKRFVV